VVHIVLDLVIVGNVQDILQHVLAIVTHIQHVQPVMVLNVAVTVILVDVIQHNVTHRGHVLVIQVYVLLMDLLVLAIQVNVTLMVDALVMHRNVVVMVMHVRVTLVNATATVLVVPVIVANAAVMATLVVVILVNVIVMVHVLHAIARSVHVTDMRALVIQDNVIVTIIVNVIRDIVQMIVPQMVFINFNDYEYNTIFKPRSNGIFRRTLEKS
jgi:hypothetical protein